MKISKKTIPIGMKSEKTRRKMRSTQMVGYLSNRKAKCLNKYILFLEDADETAEKVEVADGGEAEGKKLVNIHDFPFLTNSNRFLFQPNLRHEARSENMRASKHNSEPKRIIPRKATPNNHTHSHKHKMMKN